MGLVKEVYDQMQNKRAAKIERRRDFADNLGIDEQAFDTMLNFSEFLDSEGLIVGEDESGDERSHEDLVDDFLSGLLARLRERGSL